jgi:mannose-6-phosphate isomerase
MPGISPTFDLLAFEPAVFERIWGGRSLGERLSLPLPTAAAYGEAWLLSDHPVHESRVSAGPYAGRSIHELLALDERALLGSLPRRTRGGRFPLMLKLLDCRELLSVQIHPDDALSAALGEEDGGKTEMWYFLDAAPDAEIICGLDDAPSAEALEAAARAGSIGGLLRRWPVHPGDAALVRAGTVHALGKGLLAAEIQQSSDVTYRLFDWNRVGADGQPRALHIEQAMRCVALGTPFDGLARSVALPCEEGVIRELLGVCEFFATERVRVAGGAHARAMDGESFELVLALEGSVRVSTPTAQVELAAGRAVLVPGCQAGYEISGAGGCLVYYVSGAGEKPGDSFLGTPLS